MKNSQKDIQTDRQKYQQTDGQKFNPNRAGLLMLLESGGGLNQPAPSRSPQNTVKNQKLFLLFLQQSSDWSKTHSRILKPMMLLGNDTPHDYVFWSKTPSFSGVQYKFGVLLTTKRGCFGYRFPIITWV